MNRSYIPWIILAVLLGLFIGYCVWGPTWGVPPNLKSDVLKDTLAIVLTVVSIAVAVVGFFIYRVVSSALEREMGRKIMMESRRWITRLAISTSYSLWESGFRSEAIRIARETVDKYASGLSVEDPENTELVGVIMNNLASYFSIVRQERDLARGYAEYIHGISHKFPTHRETWERTYQEVLSAFPS